MRTGWTVRKSESRVEILDKVLFGHDIRENVGVMRGVSLSPIEELIESRLLSA